MSKATPSTSDDPLEPLLCFDLYAASRSLTAAYRPVLAEFDLTYPQYLVLVVLAGRTDAVPIKHLRDTLHLDHATLTPLLRRLEAAGLLSRTRSATDERSVEIALTEQGREVASHFGDVQCRVSEILGLPEKDVATLRDLLHRVNASAVASLRE
ncbi:MarR family transcriptional regulator [Nocardioides fonticola]|uniref:MarR family transcriptional regulator n=1 Tax=Nocardioides fonticola TaxID=450363 RepID=A0ABP7XUE0_9ACTN